MFNGVLRSSKPIAGESLTPIGQNSLLHLEISFDFETLNILIIKKKK